MVFFPLVFPSLARVCFGCTRTLDLDPASFENYEQYRKVDNPSIGIENEAADIKKFFSPKSGILMTPSIRDESKLQRSDAVCHCLGLKFLMVSLLA